MMPAKNHAKLLSLACALAWLAGCSGSAPADDAAATPSPLSGGTTDSVNTNVFGLLVHVEGGLGACSSTLIAPNLLLTARHCISDSGSEQVICGKAGFSQPYAVNNVIASNAVDLNRARDWYHAREIVVPTEGNDTCGFDVALVILEENVPASAATPAVPRIDRQVERGEVYHAVGYGLTETADYGVRRLLTQREVQCDPGTCRLGVRGNEFVGSAGPCQGDSGGPAFDVEGKIVGIDSRGTEECGEPVYSTVTGWKDFLMTTARHAAELGGYEPSFWVTTGSSDPPVKPPPAPIETPLGQRCDGTSVCALGGACYQSASGGSPRCVAVCRQSSECLTGYDCVPTGEQIGVCLEATPSEASSSCRMTRSSSSSFSLAFVGAGLAFAARRRRGQAHTVAKSS